MDDRHQPYANTIICPYNPAHAIREECIPQHLFKCAKVSTVFDLNNTYLEIITGLVFIYLFLFLPARAQNYPNAVVHTCRFNVSHVFNNKACLIDHELNCRDRRNIERCFIEHDHGVVSSALT